MYMVVIWKYRIELPFVLTTTKLSMVATFSESIL